VCEQEGGYEHHRAGHHVGRLRYELWRLGADAPRSNVTRGDIVLDDSSGSLVFAEGLPVAALGLKDLERVAAKVEAGFASATRSIKNLDRGPDSLATQRGLVVVATPEAVLILPKDRAQEVKLLREKVLARRRDMNPR
jgi:hypothetical protein